MEQSIQLVQQPIIKHDLYNIGKSVSERIDALNIINLIATDDTIKALKSLRADLNKELADYEEQRKTLKEAVANPYMEFEAVYKAEVSEKYKLSITLLKDKIGIFEDSIKIEKRNNIIRYFDELCLSERIDFLKFENTGIEINLSTSEKQYKEKCNEFILRAVDDVALINSQEFAAEIMAEYKKTLNASKAITAVIERKAAERIERDRLQAQETNRRTIMLRSLSMVYHDITKTFNWINDDNVNIRISDVENYSLDEFNKAFIELETKIKQSSPKPLEPIKPVVSEPLKAPVKLEEIKEETFTASFEVTGTMSQLKQLGLYMKENNITYKNI